jgi:hypothetical protein
LINSLVVDDDDHPLIMADAAAMPLPPNEDRGPEILAVCGSLVGIALVMVVLRIWVRAKMVRHVGADDWTIIAAMVCPSLAARFQHD